MRHSKLKLIIFIITNGFSLSSHSASAAESEAKNDSLKNNNLSQVELESIQQIMDSSSAAATNTFNLSALANAIQDSAANSSSSSSNTIVQQYNLIDTTSGSFTDPKLIYKWHSGHSNHRDYPSEPFPSASHTSPMIVGGGGGNQSNESSSGAPQMFAQIIGVPHNHQSAYSASEHTRARFEEPKFINSYGNQSPSSPKPRNQPYQDQHSSMQLKQQQQHDYHRGSSAPMNAALIQNLTAALFPARHISNATLQTLSDLLDKSRYSSQNSFNLLQAPATGKQFRPLGGQPAALNYNHAYTNFYSPPILGGSSSPSSMLTNTFAQPDGDASLSQLSVSLLDQLSRQTNNYGYREPNKHYGGLAPLRSPTESFQQTAGRQTPWDSSNKANHHQHFNSPKPITGYNSFSGGLRDAGSSILPLLLPNGGQSLDQLAASLLANDHQQQQPSAIDSFAPDTSPRLLTISHHRNHQPTSAGAGDSSKPSQPTGGFSYVQHHQGARNHLDRVVYHSTPFRPSIVSPPSSMAPLSSSTSNQHHHHHHHHHHHQEQQQQQHQSANKSSSSSSSSKSEFGTLSAPSTSDTTKSSGDYIVGPISYSGNSSANTRHSAAQQAADKQLKLSLHASMMTQFGDDSHRQHLVRNSTSSTMGGGAANSTAGALESGATTSSNKTPAPPASSAAPHSSLIGQSSGLLDIYEREIDQQIRNALLGESGNILSAMASRLVQSPSGSVRVVSANNGGAVPATGWSYDEPASSLIDQALLASWIKSSPGQQQQLLGSPILLPASAQHIEQFIRPLSSSSQQLLDSSSATSASSALSDALQELPTFSAADLQPAPLLLDLTGGAPLAPPGGVYSPIAAASQESPMEQSSATTLGDYSAASPWPFSATSLSSAQLTTEEVRNALAQTLHQQLLDNNHSPTGKRAKHHFANSLSGHQQQQQQQQQSNLNSFAPGLPSILSKLSPFAPFISNPFSHLYSSLPARGNRNNLKAKPPPGGQKATQTGLKSGAKFKSESFSSKTPPIYSESRFRQQYASQPSSKFAAGHSHKQQNQQLASLLASLMAASSMQASSQNPNNIGSGQSSATSPPLASNMLEPLLGSDQNVPASVSPNSPIDSATNSLGLSLAGGGISPLLWRALFPSAKSLPLFQQPMATTKPEQTLSGHENLSSSSPSISASRAPEFLPFIRATNTFSAQNYLPGSHQSLLSNRPTTTTAAAASTFNSPSASSTSASHRLLAAQQHELAPTQTSITQKPTKVNIRILKIPIAVYDHPPTPGQPQSGRQTAIGLLPPAQMEAAASLLASLPCPIRHGASGSLQVAPHSIDRHLGGSVGGLGNNLSTLFAGETLSAAESSQEQAAIPATTLESLMESSQVSNQLQDSPTSANNLQENNKLLQMLPI